MRLPLPGGRASPQASRPARVLILGAAGRDFHDFNTVFRDDPSASVVAFTAAQIPDIAGRVYPPSLSGPLYPSGIPIWPESEMAALIRRERVDWAVLSYSDLAHADVMHKASEALAAGASFALLAPRETALDARRPVVSVCAVRTGVGKSALSRHIVGWLRERGHRAVAVRHPMPYGDLERQAVQRFATWEDLDRAEVTIEEREEYEPYVARGAVVFAGVDYARILRAAEEEADVILWDGGNNDLPFFRSDLHFVLLDPHRPGHETLFHPGETNFRMADAVVITKVDSAPPEDVARLAATARAMRPGVPVIEAELAVRADRPERIAGRRVVVVEDGPTLTHGGMKSGAGTVAARRFGAAAVVDARPYAVGAVAAAFRAYPHLEGEVPAMGYGDAQVRDLEATLNATPADLVLDATPASLERLVALDKPVVRVDYEFVERGRELGRILESFEREKCASSSPSAATRS
jgi:predicted GTPase